jgi:eukaryotic-like serine/threonine-protein kinase
MMAFDVADSPLGLPEVPTELKSGLSQYTLVELLGRGPTAEVHLALVEEFEGLRPYAAKLFVGQSRNAAFAEAILQISRGRLQAERPNVVHIIGGGLEAGQLFLVLEYVDGFDLADLLRRCAQQKVPLPVELGLHIVMSTLRGLEQSYELAGGGDATHSGVSMTNILIASNGEVKLGDFGLSRADAALPNAKAVFAARAGYMSPEQARGEPLDARADVFAVGIVLWELLLGRRCYRPPRPGTGTASLLTQALLADIVPPPPRGRRREDQLYDIVQHAVARSPSHRYASPGAMLRELESYALAVDYTASDAHLAEWLNSRFSPELTRRRLVLEEAASRVFAMKLQARSRPPPVLDAKTVEDVRAVGPDRESDPDDLTEMTYIERDDELPTCILAVEPGAGGPVVRVVVSPSFVPPRASRAPPVHTESESGPLPVLAAAQVTGSYPPAEEIVRHSTHNPPPVARRSGFLWLVLVVLLLALVAAAVLLPRGSIPFL